MYIKKVVIDKIRSIEHFEMDFGNTLAGWHVVIGDNGAGKSSIIRSTALGVLGLENAKALSNFEDFSTWLPPNTEKASISITAWRDNNYDLPKYNGSKDISSSITIERINGNGKVQLNGRITPKNAMWGDYSSNNGWFLSAYGPFRRLRGGAEIFAHIVSSRPRLGACLTAFRDDVALTQLTGWLKDLALDSQKNKKAKSSLDRIIHFINEAKLLPGDAILLDDIDSNGIKLQDGNGVNVSLFEMSDGYRSVLSMTIDIIRFLMETYGPDKVFPDAGQKTINVPGVVLIDEVDAHLHPTWQTKIGKWFTSYFPEIQFIVTTHSPLVCRACGPKGKIWRLATPGSDHGSELVDTITKMRLIYGDILDAYGTELFGEDISQSAEGEKMTEELTELSKKAFSGKEITEEDKARIQELKKILPTV